MRPWARLTLLARQGLLGAAVGVLCGVASAVFLVLLERATAFRGAHESIVYALPLGGLLLGGIYERWGQSISSGTNLVIDTIHDEGPHIPLRMAPFVLVGTVITHLFGGSAGREGTAVQMGASLADALARARWLRVDETLRVQLIAAGVAGGFGSVFGTPVAGVVFGLEVVVIGRLRTDGVAAALAASLVGDAVTRAVLGEFSVAHTPYPTVAHTPLSPTLALWWLVFAVVVAALAGVFIELTHALKKQTSTLRLPLRLFVGGVVVVVSWKLVGTSDVLGLGVPTIVRAFSDETLSPWLPVLKLLFTAVTLGAGFVGGEVTPLFFIGATAGGVFARVASVPVDLGAAVGMAAVFAAASNTPLALSIMAVELCGSGVLPHVVIVSVVAFVVVGDRSIYPAQRFGRTKAGVVVDPPTSLQALRSAPPPSSSSSSSSSSQN